MILGINICYRWFYIFEKIMSNPELHLLIHSTFDDRLVHILENCPVLTDILLSLPVLYDLE